LIHNPPPTGGNLQGVANQSLTTNTQLGCPGGCAGQSATNVESVSPNAKNDNPAADAFAEPPATPTRPSPTDAEPAKAARRFVQDATSTPTSTASE